MALQVVEFFGHAPLDPAAAKDVSELGCPFVGADCIKPKHGACSVRQKVSPEPVICCPNRIYADQFRVLEEIAVDAFGGVLELIRPAEVPTRRLEGRISGREVVVFGRYWGQELPLPRPQGATKDGTRKYYVDWVLAKIDDAGDLEEMTAVEVQTIDTTGNYNDQVGEFFAGRRFVDRQGRDPGFSGAGMNWENVNKRILPQVIYKGHVLRRESRCKKGLYFVCPEQVQNRIRERLAGDLLEYPQGAGAINFWSYRLGPEVPLGQFRGITRASSFTTTVDQVALAFTSPKNLPEGDVYESAINAALLG